MLNITDGQETVPFVDLTEQYRSIRAEIDAAIQQALWQSDFILGSEVNCFEASFAQFVGTEHAVGVGSGTEALRLALQVLDIGHGDEVILPVNTYIATAFAITAVGARPVMVDCNPLTYNIEISGIEPAITSRTRAIIPVHLAGQAAEMEPLLEIANRRHIHVIEDAAQAHGSFYQQRPCGSLGTMGCFSFYPSKNLGAYGDGGIITTNDQSLAERLRRLRNYGQGDKNEHIEYGWNSRLDTLQAAILNVKLRHLPKWNAARVRLAQKYMKLLQSNCNLRFQQCATHSTHVYHLFFIATRHRNALQRHLTHAGIQTGIHYPKPIHLQSAYSHLGYKPGDFPHAERLANELLSLPMFPELHDDQLECVAQSIRTFFG